MTLRRILTAALGLSLLAACGEDSTQSRESELEDYARAHGVDADVEVGESGEVRSVTINQGAGKVGSNLALPDDFPDDVPVYENLKLHAVTPIPGGGLSLSGIAGGDLGEVARFYAAEMVAHGWTDASPPPAAPSQRTLQFTKGSRNVMITLMPASPGTSVSITLIGSG
ncbi:MAG: hypothetical protein CVT81_00915 [Alphaproteobacteria bacterium HGW-Alphaproteobacteria-3]|nr:MAG: hypothetical protein CVT81_00915 [Alphaproteobacteria bacterium HGW-Alphaproteobacteria-3]